MDWLFERLIELAAWVAFILGLVFFIEAGYLLVQWGLSLRDAADPTLLRSAGRSAGEFVLAALAMGALACIDRYVFDASEQPRAK